MSDERVGPCGEHCAVVHECDARGREITRLRAENEKLQRKLHDAIVKYQRMLMQYEPAKAAGLADATFKGDATDG